MSNFNWKKSIEDSIKDGLIITATTTEIFFALKAANVKHQRHLWMLWISSKLPVEYVEGCIIGERLCSLQKMDQRVMQQKFHGP